jgi:hypothetical protein
MPYADQPVRSGPARKRGPGYDMAVAEVRRRAQQGEGCFFRGVCPMCPGVWDWGLPSNHGDAFTAHHLHRVMEGGSVVVDPALMAPAHRRCNAWDGLTAQNARRAGRKLEPRTYTPAEEHTSRVW